MRSAKTTLGLAVLGAALMSTAAFAQDYKVGRAANDGGMVQAQTNTNAGTQRTGAADRERTTRGPGYASDTRSMTGGTLYNSAAPQGGFHYPVGRAANDGGMVSPQQQAR
jgi:hypothetical protein